ncbi:hypothetical protein OH76DRAFT_1364818, partial [Lentinus brumalis]
MDQSPRPPKRPRVDSDSATAKPWIADSQVWFDDGNVILVAEEVAFRVYKGALAQFSNVFRALFSLPAPETDPHGSRNDAEQFDNVPVVHLADSHVDIKHLLLTFSCSYYCHNGKPSTPEFSVLFALVTLGDKYDIPHILEEALSCLQRYYAPTLAQWRKVKTRADYVKTNPEDAMAVVRIARITGQFDLLSPAFLVCTTLRSQLLDKMGEPDG